MFKFGRNAQPIGPYSQYTEPVNPVTGSTRKRSGTYAGSPEAVKAAVQKAQEIRASCTFPNYGAGMSSDTSSTGGMFGGGVVPAGFGDGGTSVGGGRNGNHDRYNPVYDQLEEGTILEDWIPRDGAGLDLLFRRIYLRDPVIGPGVDIIRHLPWSDFTLEGVDDPAIRRVYEDCLNALNLPLLMPDITGDYLVIGRNIISLIFDERKGIFNGVVPHDPDFVRVSPLPVYGFDPLCDFKLSPGFRKFLLSSDPRAIDARRSLPSTFLQAAQSDQGFLPLDPVSTVYLGRKASQHDQIGTSLLTRCLYFWAIEKALLNAQMASTRRRARSFVHLVAGIDQIWEPTREELDELAGLIIAANEDPTGGVVATRTGVTISEPVGGGQDFYKWSDELELFSKYKMLAIGISEALLSGDATYNNAEQARSVFVENLATMRYRIVHKMFYDKIFPTLARLHGFQKRTKAEINHGYRIGSSRTQSNFPMWAELNQVTASRLTSRKAMQIPTSELIMPTISWAKQLRPNQDEEALAVLERLQAGGYPITLKQWAQAAGFNPKNIIQEVKEDKDMLTKIENIQSGGEGGGDTDTDLPDGEAGGGDQSAPMGDEGADDAGGEAADDGGNEPLPPGLIIPEEKVTQSLDEGIKREMARAALALQNPKAADYGGVE